MAEPTIAPEDLRAAVAAGILTEAQAAHLNALAARRHGKRAAMPAEDEPFEFFRGFAEIFVSLGLAILLAGIAMLLIVIGGGAILIVLPALLAAAAWWMARYFTLRRRMNLPSMVLVTAYALGVQVSLVTLLFDAGLGWRAVAFLSMALTAGAVGLWFARFRLPFAMFVLGLAGFGAISVLTVGPGQIGNPSSAADWARALLPRADMTLAAVIFGVIAFAAAMWFDMKDPYRQGRHSATAFWLHLLAGTTLVNAIVGGLYDGGSGSLLATALALAFFAMVALIVDRRSILTAGIVYIGALMWWTVAGDGAGSASEFAVVLIMLGLFFTVLGTWWVQLRAALMRALPDFPGKDRLPPYAETP